MTDYDKWAQYEEPVDDENKENSKPADYSDVLKEIPDPLNNDLALCLAAKEKKYDIMEELLKNKADVNTKDPRGRTPLHILLAKPCTPNEVRPFVEKLLEFQADINIEAGTDKETPLSLATYAGHEQLMETLLDGQVRNQRALDHALFYAAKNCEPILARRLLAANAAPWGYEDESHFWSFHYWAAQGDVSLLRVAIYDGKFKTVDCGSTGEITPLHIALRHTELKNVCAVATILLEAKADVNKEAMNGETPLNMCRDEKSTELLLAHGADVNKIPRLFKTALVAASEGVRSKQIALLLEHNANPNICDLSPLCFTVRNENFECTKLLLEADADPNRREPYTGCIPLPFAAQLESAPLVDLLLKHKADASLEDQNGISAFFRTTSSDVALILMTKGGINPNTINSGKTALVLAAGSGNEELCKVLMDARANVNQLGPCTPLMSAAANGHENTVHLLLERGADKLIRCNGFNARSLAEKSDFPELANIIDNFK